LVLVLFIALNRKTTNIIYFGILGSIGLLFTLIGLYSLHREILWNYNILLFNPLNLFLIYFIIKNNAVWIKKMSRVCLLLLAVYLLYMLNKAHLMMVLPLIATSAILLLRVARKNN
jgi:hypothetical protein